MSIDLSHVNLFEYFLSGYRLHRFGNHTAIEFRDRRITFNQLRDEVDHWARRVLSRGMAPSDRVALLLYDSPAFIACFLATASVGAVCVPINTFLSAHDIEFILADSGARLLIVESELEDKVNLSAETGNRSTVLKVNTRTRSCSELGDVNPRIETPAITATIRETPAFLLYTSGSTGTPKGVLHSHGSIPFSVESYADNVVRLTSEDRVFPSSRMFFAYGLGDSLSFPLAAGAAVILEPERMNAERLARFIEDRKPTVFFGVDAVVPGCRRISSFPGAF